MILLYTDFGFNGPYVGAMHAAIRERAPTVPIIDLMHDAPRFAPRPAGRLLAALVPSLPRESIIVAVVDPGVGTDRRPVVVAAFGRFFVGPDNGLFDGIVRRDPAARAWEIVWRPASLSASFHGRDLFAPVAARLATTPDVDDVLRAIDPAGICRMAWPADPAEVIYLDDFGNAMTGLDGALMAEATVLEAGRTPLTYARTFGDRPEGTPFWYRNSIDLVEITVSSADAAQQLGLVIGSPVTVRTDGLGAQPAR